MLKCVCVEKWTMNLESSAAIVKPRYNKLWSIFTHSLWRGVTIWCHITWSTLVQTMTWCLLAPSYYLNRCWLLSTEVFKILHLGLQAYLPGAKEWTHCDLHDFIRMSGLGQVWYWHLVITWSNWVLICCILKNKFQWNLNQNTKHCFNKIHFKTLPARCQQFCSCISVVNKAGTIWS